MRALFVGKQRFVHFFAVAYAYDFNIVFISAEQFAYRLRLSAYGARGRFLNQNVAALALFKRKQHQIHRLVQRHYKARHIGMSDGYGLMRAYLIYPKRNDAAARTHHVAVTGTAYLGLFGGARFCNDDLFHHGFACPHCIYGIGGFVGRQTYYRLHTFIYRRRKHVVGAQNIGFHRFDGEKLA